MREGRSAQKRIHCKSLLKLNQSVLRSHGSQLLDSPPPAPARCDWEWSVEGWRKEPRSGCPEARGQLQSLMVTSFSPDETRLPS